MKEIGIFFALLTSLTLFSFKALANGETISPNMQLVVPAVGITSGPQWAADIDISLGLIDSHDHTPGKGVQITPAGLNINSDLTIQTNNLTNPRSVRFAAQSSSLSGAADLGAIYESGVDLYYVDGNGNNIRLTQSGSIVGATGNISGLSAPASASYVSGSSTFVWQSAVNTSANLDAACLLQRNLTASSNAITLCAPSSLASNYSITWPASLPASTKIATFDSSGNIGDVYDVDQSTLTISSNLLQIKNSGVNTPQLADGSVTPAKRAALGQQISSSCGSFTTTNTSFTAVTNLSVTITTTGRPVMLMIISDGTTTTSYINGGSAVAGFAFFRGSTQLSNYSMVGSGIIVPSSSLQLLDPVAAGTYTYTLRASTSTGGSASIFFSKLAVYEL